MGWLLFGFLLCIYLLTGKGFSEILDAENYYLICKALVEEGKLGIRPELSSATLRGDEPVKNGRAMPHYGLGYPLFLVPFYVAGKAARAVVVPLVPRAAIFGGFFTRASTSVALAVVTALTAVVVYLWLLHLGYSLGWAVAGGLIFGLATFAWPYAKIGFYEPFLGLCQALALLWASVYASRRQARWVLLSGFAAGWGIATKLSLGLLLPVLIAYLAWAALSAGPSGRWRALATSAGAFAAGMAPWVAVIAWYNYARTGSPLVSGYTPAEYMPSSDPAQVALALYGHTFSPGRGFFLFSPITLCAVPGAPRLWHTARPALVAMLAVIASSLLYTSTIARWANDYAWGPRLLEPLTPLAVVLAVPGIAACWPRRWARAIILALLVASVAVQLLGLAISFAPWIDHVWRETGSWRPLAFSPRYAPFWGQIVLLSNATLAPMDVRVAEVAGGELTEAFKTEVRRTPDFWFAYAWRLGLPRLAIVLGALTPLALCLLLAFRLQQALARHAATAHCH